MIPLIWPKQEVDPQRHVPNDLWMHINEALMGNMQHGQQISTMATCYNYGGIWNG